MAGLTPEQRRILKPVLFGLGEDQAKALENAVQAAGEATSSHFVNEMVIGMRQREKRAWAVAIAGLLCGALGVGVGFYGLARNETQAYLAIVDKDTGIAERAVTVQRASIDQQQAIIESLVHAYVRDRETYDIDDNEYRILSVFRRSAPNIRQALERLWTPGNANFPPDVYGVDGRVTVEIRNIVPIDEDTLQVRFSKELKRPNAPDQIGDFVATVTYRFEPSTVENNLLLWQNPFGFQVIGYRVASEGASK